VTDLVGPVAANGQALPRKYPIIPVSIHPAVSIISPHFVQLEQFGRHNWLFRARWYAPDSPEIRAILG